jgi:hypothetical protein
LNQCQECHGCFRVERLTTMPLRDAKVPSLPVTEARASTGFSSHSTGYEHPDVERESGS